MGLGVVAAPPLGRGEPRIVFQGVRRTERKDVLQTQEAVQDLIETRPFPFGEKIVDTGIFPAPLPAHFLPGQQPVKVLRRIEGGQMAEGELPGQCVIMQGPPPEDGGLQERDVTSAEESHFRDVEDFESLVFLPDLPVQPLELFPARLLIAVHRENGTFRQGVQESVGLERVSGMDGPGGRDEAERQGFKSCPVQFGADVPVVPGHKPAGGNAAVKDTVRPLLFRRPAILPVADEAAQVIVRPGKVHPGEIDVGQGEIRLAHRTDVPLPGSVFHGLSLVVQAVGPFDGSVFALQVLVGSPPQSQDLPDAAAGEIVPDLGRKLAGDVFVGEHVVKPQDGVLPVLHHPVAQMPVPVPIPVDEAAVDVAETVQAPAVVIVMPRIEAPPAIIGALDARVDCKGAEMPLFRDIIQIRFQVLNPEKALGQVVHGILKAPDVGTFQRIDIAVILPGDAADPVAVPTQRFVPDHADDVPFPGRIRTHFHLGAGYGTLDIGRKVLDGKGQRVRVRLARDDGEMMPRAVATREHQKRKKDWEDLFHRSGMLYVLPSGEVTSIRSSKVIFHPQGLLPRVILYRVTLSREAFLSEKRKAMPLPDSPSQN